MATWARIKWAWDWAERIHFAYSILGGVAGGIVMLFWAAADSKNWSQTEVLLYALAAGAIVAVFVAAVALVIDLVRNGSKKTRAENQTIGSIAASSLPTWFDLEQRFRELEPALQFSRIDGQTGAAGEHWRIAGGAVRYAEDRFNAVAAIASAKLFQDFLDDVNRHKELVFESNPTIRWYKALQYIGNRYKPSPHIVRQINDDGSSAGFLYTGSIDQPASASATLCLQFASRVTG